MFYVYLLKSVKHNSIYIGYTSDLKKRVNLHNGSKVPSTKKGTPWEIVYYEAYKIKHEETHREKMLKHDGKSRTWLLKRNKLALKKGAA